MKWGLSFGALLALSVFTGFGCQSRSFVSMGRDANGHDFAVPTNSIDGYAKEHGISREEAAKRMRAELVPPSDSHADSTPAAP